MAVIQVPSKEDTLVIVAEFQGSPPEALFNYWTQPDLLREWWPQQAEIDPRVGGDYHLSWPRMNWHLRGRYIAFEPAKKLAFTWRWDHDPVNRDVVIIFEPLAEGRDTKMVVTHGPYTDSAKDQEERQGHIEGWLHFIAKLQSLLNNKSSADDQ